MFYALFLGLGMGIIAGLVPSLGSASIMLVCLPLLLAMDPVHALYAYLALVISNQYLGSVTAIYTGVPGTEASVPTAREYPTIRSLGLSGVAIRQNATASVWGNVLGLGLMLVTLPILHELLVLYKNSIRLGIVSTTFAIIVLMSEKKLNALVSLALGSFLVSLGYDSQTFETFNLGLSIFDNGVSWVVLLMGSLVGASIYRMRKMELQTETKQDIESTPIFSSVVRGAGIGFVAGLVPGLSYILSSSLAYTVERSLRVNESQQDRTLKSIAASESAQSAGSVSMLIPFLLFSIPITAGEGVIMNVVTLHDTLENLFAELTGNLPLLFGYFILVNVISYMLARSARVVLKVILRIPVNVIQAFLIASGVVAVYMTTDFGLAFDLVCYFVLMAVFYRTKLDPLPFIMGVLLWPTLSNDLYFFKELM